RAHARRLPEARRRELHEAHDGLPGGRRSLVRCDGSHQAGLEARGHHELPAHGEEVLIMTDVGGAAADAANDSRVQSFLVTFNIRRFDPEVDEEPRWVDYDVELYATDRVLDALHKIKWEVDGSLSFRRSCAHGICGSDAMRINGRNRLACKTLIKDL